MAVLASMCLECAEQGTGAAQFAEISSGLGKRVAGATSADEARRAEDLLHRIRNWETMVELVRSMPQAVRPTRILYLASGAHLAPLALCELLAPGASCVLKLTEVDGSIEVDIADTLQSMANEGWLKGLAAGPALAGKPGIRNWSFELSGHEVALFLAVARPGSKESALITTEKLKDVDLVISHDWSGDPLINLRVIYELLGAARGRSIQPPLLMLEDLEAHPFPVDLSLFVPVARASRPYGHRSSEAGVGRHGRVELGVPLFGGGVLLSFADPWWRRVDQSQLEGVCNFLLFAPFDNERQNVLEGGGDPLLAPLMLDWWTGYGYRLLDGSDVRRRPEAKQAMVDAMIELTPRLTEPLRQRMACELKLYHCLLEVSSRGGDLDALMPSARLKRRLQPEEFPAPEMKSLYQDAMRNRHLYQADKELEQKQALALAKTLQSDRAVKVLALCPVALEVEDGEVAWAGSYERIARWLRGSPHQS
jgi:hypothetical protein